ncbi:30S ribosomal protein S10 [Candidatus Gracilibacteria bacterium]|nr:30S ribosomal protein S10 [Candidatus Gracilibacteria bacterium]
MATKKNTAPAKKTSSRAKASPRVAAPKSTSHKKPAGKEVQPTSLTGGKKGGVTVPRVRIIVRSFDYTVIDEATKLIVETAERGGSLVSGPVLMPTHIRKYTVNRSFFIRKDARDQYEIRTHKRLIDIKEPTSQTIEALQNLSLPAGVDVEIKMI